jgi:hypothetical protein
MSVKIGVYFHLGTDFVILLIITSVLLLTIVLGISNNDRRNDCHFDDYGVDFEDFTQ